MNSSNSSHVGDHVFQPSSFHCKVIYVLCIVPISCPESPTFTWNVWTWIQALWKKKAASSPFLYCMHNVYSFSIRKENAKEVSTLCLLYFFKWGKKKELKHVISQDLRLVINIPGRHFLRSLLPYKSKCSNSPLTRNLRCFMQPTDLPIAPCPGCKWYSPWIWGYVPLWWRTDATPSKWCIQVC